jgi:hypothetical protein
MSTIERLQDEYRQADLHPKYQQLVSDEEVNKYLNGEHWIFPWLFWAIILAAILFVGVVQS